MLATVMFEQVAEEDWTMCYSSLTLSTKQYTADAERLHDA